MQMRPFPDAEAASGREQKLFCYCSSITPWASCWATDGRYGGHTSALRVTYKYPLTAGKSPLWFYFVSCLGLLGEGLPSSYSPLIRCLAFMRALSARGQSRDTLPYKAMLQPWFSWYGIFFNALIIITNGFTAFIPWNTSDFFVAYVSLILFAVLYVGHKIMKRTSVVNPAEADLDTGRKEIEEMYFEEAPPKNLWEKFWHWLS